MAPPQMSLDSLQDLGLCLDKLVVPQLPGLVTQVLWTRTEICDENWKEARMVKTRVAPFCAQSRAGVSAWLAQRTFRTTERE